MKILVCIAKTPDTTAKISFSDNNTKFNDAGVTFIINPYDEWYSLVRALELKEAGIASEVHLVSVGSADTDAIIRKALALGGDQSFRIDSAANDPFEIANEIAALVKQNGYDLVLTGKESIDYNNASVGATLAGLLDYNFIALATKLEVSGTTATVTREIEGGEETDTVALPLVLSCQKGMAEARIPNMKGIMSARTKPLTVVPASTSETLTEIVSYEMPPAKSGVKLFTIEQVDELVQALQNEAKVI